MVDDFTSAVQKVRSLPASPPMDNDTKLLFYSLYKQATEGDVNIRRPDGIFAFEGKAKWDAWNELRGVSQEKAKQRYVSELNARLRAAGQ